MTSTPPPHPQLIKKNIGFFDIKKNDFATPESLFTALDDLYHFDFDPCPLHGLEEGFDGLNSDWGKMNFVNPPYSSIRPWIEKALDEIKNGNSSVFLITCRTNTKYWHELIFPNATGILLLDKTVKFGGFQKPLPIPLALVEFDVNKPKNKFEICNLAGHSAFKL